MGELRQRGKIWWLRYYRNGRRFEESSRTSSYEDARDQLRLKEGDLAKGMPVSPRADKLRFEDAVADVLNDYTVNGRKTHDHAKRRIDLHLTPAFRGRRMTDLTTADNSRVHERPPRGRRIRACGSMSASASQPILARALRTLNVAESTWFVPAGTVAYFPAFCGICQ
jgi:hypothetical protein